MRRIAKWLLILGGIFILIQFIRPLRSNPPVDPAREITAVQTVTPAVSSILQRSCYDCHSNRTAWPWYSNVAPASWLVANDVNGARRHMNFSEWGSYKPERKKDLVDKICEEVKSSDMPESQYTLIHRNARLSAADVEVLCSWTQQIESGK